MSEKADSIVQVATSGSQPLDSLTTKIQALLQDSIASTRQVEELQGQVDTLQTTVTALCVVVIVLIAGYLLRQKKLKKLQSLTDGKQDDKLAELEAKIDQKLNTAASDVNALKGKVNDLTIRAEQTEKPEPPTETITYGSAHVKVQKEEAPREQQQAKYFTLQESEGRLLVRERNLKNDSSRGWFVMHIDGNSASYDINPNAIPSILADLATLGFFANAFEANANAKGIRTQSKGKLHKNGDCWIVTEKITIELI